MSKGMEDQMRLMKRQIAQQFVKSWKINKALYAQYGGRVIFQQAGVEPLDAYRDFLKEQEKKGAGERGAHGSEVGQQAATGAVAEPVRAHREERPAVWMAAAIRSFTCHCPAASS
jgi:hypothetical protein